MTLDRWSLDFKLAASRRPGMTLHMIRNRNRPARRLMPSSLTETTRMTRIHDLTAQALSSAYRAKQLSPVEVARAALARSAAWEAKINAMYVVDAAGALAGAAESEARWRAGAPLSALDGVPITIKDNIPVKGFATPVGTAAGDMTPAAADAPPSQRVREAGCVIIGKTTMPDYGMLASGVSSLHGITCHPSTLSLTSRR